MKEGKNVKRILAVVLAVMMLFSAVPFGVFAADAHTHTLTNVAAKAPTCKEEGIIAHFFCYECNGYFSDAEAKIEIPAPSVVVPKTAHTPVKTAEIKATCIAGGNNEYWTCVICKDVFKDKDCTIATTVENETVAKRNHDTVKQAAKEATCLAEGQKEHYTCNTCGKFFKDAAGTIMMTRSEIFTGKTAHTSLTRVPAQASTCSETGIVEHYKCNVCNSLFKDKDGKIAATAADIVEAKKAHTSVALQGRPATCTTAGLSDGSKCSACGEVFLEQKEIKALGHDLINYEYQAATCYATGKTAGYKCKREGCTYEKKQETIAKLEHKYGTTYEVITEATCDKEGVQALVCTNKGCTQVKAGSQKAIAKKAHTWDDKPTVDKAPTCSATGSESIHCKNCAEKKDVKTLAKLEHKWDEGVIKQNPTCSKEGSKVYTCADCKTTKTEKIEKLGHDYKEDVKKATCEADGYTVKTCKNCQEYYITDRVAKYGHKFTTYIPNNDATCTKDGTQTAKCDNDCGKTDTIADVGTITEHKLTEWKTVKPATCTEDGAEEVGCFNCSYIEGREIEALGHTITEATEFTIDKAATCTESGLKAKYCTRCSHKEQETVIPALGHNMQVDVSAGTTATCLEGGKKVEVCANGCGKKDVTENAPALGHSFTNYVSNNDATCSKDGTETAKCDRCDIKDTRDVEGSKLPHTYGEADIILVKASRKAPGNIKKTCAICGDVDERVIPQVTKFTLSATKFVYNGKDKLPTLTITDSEGKELVRGEDYTYEAPVESSDVGTYKYVVRFMGEYEGGKNVSYKVLPGVTSKFVAGNFKQTSIKLAWKAVPGATGYRVFLYNAKSGKYTTITNTKKTSYVVTKLTAGTDYKFAVRAYNKDGDTIVWADDYKTITVSTKTLATKTVKATAGSKSATIKWSKVTGNDGYVLYMYKGKEWVRVKATKETSYTVKNLKSGTTYKFMVKAFVKNGSETVYSPASKTVQVKAK